MPKSLILVLATVLASGCSKDERSQNVATNGAPNSAPNAVPNNDVNSVDVPTDPVVLDATEFTFRLAQSTPTLPIWTTPVTHRPTPQDRPPDAERSELRISAVRGEFEVLQLLFGPGSGSATVSVAPMPGIAMELATVQMVDGWAETIAPSAAMATVDAAADAPRVVWLTVKVPDDATPGEHTTTVTVGAAETPLVLYVYDFSIAGERHFKTQMNVDVSSLVGAGSVDDAKTTLFDLRFTPKSVTWPSGFNPSITWDNGANPCEAFWDEPEEGEQYAIGAPLHSR